MRRKSITGSACFLTVAMALAGGCSDDSKPTGGGAPVGIAVVSSDYMSVSVSLVDPAGALTRDDCINSGTTAPQLSQALSGDVVLPSQPQTGHAIVLIDRANAALTWLDAATCTAAKQISVGAKTNPRDVVSASETKLYVTRYDKTADGGDDVLILDPAAGTQKGRIDLSGQTTAAMVQARPNRAVLAAGKVFVTLDELSADFMTAGPGRIVVIDPTTDQVAGVIDLPSQKGCQALAVHDKSVFVACGGSFSDADQAAGSALVVIDAGATPPVVKQTIAASAFGGRALSSASVAALSGAAYVVTSGAFMGPPPDEMWAVNLAAGGAAKIASGSGGFVFGGLLADGGKQRLFLADGDAKTPQMQMFEVSAPVTPKAMNPFPVSAATGLPPREVAFY